MIANRLQKSLMFLMLIPLLVSACGGKVASPATSQPAAQEPYAPAIDPANFVDKIDNAYMPLIPGTTFIYEGKTENGNEHVEVVVTSETKVSMGVTCIVVKDTVSVDGVVTEDTLDWYAQDKQGNVWYFGEDTKEFQDGKVSSTAGTWEAGVDGALPGIIMGANSAVGDTYRQEYYKGQAEDVAAVLSLSESASVPYGSYSDLIMINEWNALDNPAVYEHKYYAKGIGVVMTKYVEGGYELRLIDIRHE